MFHSYDEQLSLWLTKKLLSSRQPVVKWRWDASRGGKLNWVCGSPGFKGSHQAAKVCGVQGRLRKEVLGGNVDVEWLLGMSPKQEGKGSVGEFWRKIFLCQRVAVQMLALITDSPWSFQIKQLPPAMLLNLMMLTVTLPASQSTKADVWAQEDTFCRGLIFLCIAFLFPSLERCFDLWSKETTVCFWRGGHCWRMEVLKLFPMALWAACQDFHVCRAACLSGD